MIAEKYPELSKLSIEEKRDLVAELCEEIAAQDANGPDPVIVEILESRWKAHCEDPSGEVTLEEFRKRIGMD